MKLDLLGKYPIKSYNTFFTFRAFEEFRKKNPNRKVIIIDTGLYDDDYFDKLFIKKDDDINN